MLEAIQHFDTGFVLWINGIHTAFLDSALLFITRLGDRGLIWILISICLLFSRKTRPYGILTLASLLLVSILGVGILKNLIQRPRPYEAIEGLNLLIRLPSDPFSFPSGHSGSSFAAASMIAAAFRGRAPAPAAAAWILAGLIVFSRLYLMVHYPTDVLGGMALGLFCTFLILTLHKRFFSDKMPLR